MSVPISIKLMLIVGTGLLSGCCSNVTTDPRDGGLQGGVCGSATGAYDERVAALAARAGSLDAANARLSASLKATEGEARNLDRAVAAKRARLARIRAELDQLAQNANQREALRGEIHALMAQAAERERAVMAIEDGIRTARNEQVREDAIRRAKGIPIDDLLDEIKRLRASITP